MLRHTIAAALLMPACTTVIVGPLPETDDDTTAAPVDDDESADASTGDASTGAERPGSTGEISDDTTSTSDDSTTGTTEAASTGDASTGSTGDEPLPSGAACEDAAECASGRCMFGQCVDACDLAAPDCDNVAACLPATATEAGCVPTGIDTIDAGVFEPNGSPAGYADGTGDRDVWITDVAQGAGLYSVVIKTTAMSVAVLLPNGDSVAGPGEALDQEETMWRYAFNAPADSRVFIVLTAAEISEPESYYLYVNKL